MEKIIGITVDWNGKTAVECGAVTKQVDLSPELFGFISAVTHWLRKNRGFYDQIKKATDGDLDKAIQEEIFSIVDEGQVPVPQSEFRISSSDGFTLCYSNPVGVWIIRLAAKVSVEKSLQLSKLLYNQLPTNQ